MAGQVTYTQPVPLETAIAIVLATLVIGSVLYVLAARLSPEGGRGEKTPTNVYAVTGGAMSLLIAFTMSLTYATYLDAAQASQEEAEAVTAMSRAATFMDASVRDPLRDQLVCYAQEVITQEWPSMRAGSSSMPLSVRQTLNDMDSTLAENFKEAGSGLAMWEEANQTRHAAHVQRLQAASSGVPAIVWLLLIFGSLITIGSLFVYADRSKPAWGHVLVVIGPLFVASAALVVIAFFDHPYAETPGAIAPVAMQSTLDTLTSPAGTGADMPVPQCPSSPQPS